MTAFTALLAVKEVSQMMLSVYVAVLQSADPSGAIQDSVSTIRRHHNRTFNTRITKSQVKTCIDNLVEKGIMPSRQATYPFASDDTNMNVDEVLEALKESIPNVRPDVTEFPDQTRIFAALKMANVLEIAMKEKKIRVEDDERSMVIDGQQVKIGAKVWDYGLIGKLKSQYGTEKVIDTICQIHLHDRFDQFRKESFTFKQRRRHFRKYLIGALKGEEDPADDSETGMIY